MFLKHHRDKGRDENEVMILPMERTRVINVRRRFINEGFFQTEMKQND